MTQNLDRFKFRFYHFKDKKIYDVITFQKLPTEKFIRCFLTRPLPNGMSIDDVEKQLKIEERAEQNLILNQKSGIDGELMQSTGLKDKNDKLIFEGDVLKIQLLDPDENIVENDAEEESFDVVGFENGSFGKYWNYNKKTKEFTDFEIFPSKSEAKYSTMEVVGNIYENLDLLKKL